MEQPQTRMETASELAPRSYSGRGERRPQTARAWRSNHPLELPSGVNGLSAQGRRWRDLSSHYSAVLGKARMKQEDIRARVRGLISLSIEIERMQDDRLCGKTTNLQLLLHLQQEQRCVLNELGLTRAHNGSEPPVLANYLRSEAAP